MHPKDLLATSAELVKLVLKFDHPADAIVSRFFRDNKALGPRERGTLSDTVYNVLRKKLYYDHLAPSGSGPKERRLAILGFPGDRNFVKTALNESECNWLDQCDGIDPKDLMDRHRHNLPEWLVEPLKVQLADEGANGFWSFVNAINGSAPLDLRVNSMTAKRADIEAELNKHKITCKPTPFSPLGLRLANKPSLAKADAFTRGAIEVQDEGSQLLAMLVDAKRSEMVVDFCAGAGGKTLAIGAAMRNTGRLYAFDISAHRLDALKPRLARSGLSNVHPVAIAHERDDRIKRLAGKIDRVLVDAPCSGLGTLRRNPDLKWRQTPAIVEELTKLQAAILQSAARLLKPGGRLVYATCSLLPQENEQIAEAFTAANPDFVPQKVEQILTDLKVENAALLCGSEGNFLRLWPHKHSTDGFFAAVWTKK